MSLMSLNKLFRLYQAPEGEPSAAPPAAPPATPPAAPSPPATPPNPESPPPAPPGPKWPDDWRNQMAGENAEALKTLGRFASPSALYESYNALRQKLSSGELKPHTPFPDKGTPEEQTAWRQAQGIPDAPDKYELKLKDGLVVGEDDKPIIDDFLKAAHAAHTPPGVVNAAVQWYFDFQAKEQELLAAGDNRDKQGFEDALRSEWGNEYRPNMNRVHGLLDTAPAGFKDLLLGGRLADGTLVSSSPDAMRFLAGVALQINPTTTLVPGAGANIEQAIGDEIAKLEGMMGNRASEYWVGPNAEKNQQRYRDLVAARDRNKAA